MPAKKDCVREKCDICRRSTFDHRTLGPLVHTKTISAHFNCVLYSPVTPDATSLAPRAEDDAIAGVSTRSVRDEAKRAKKLVITNSHISSFIFFVLFSDICLSTSLSLTHSFFLRHATIARLSARTLAVAKILAPIWRLNFVPKNIM